MDTTRRQIGESDLEKAIDAVAEQMTAVEAPAAMRASVLERVEGGAARGGRLTAPGWAWAGALAVVVAVAAGVWFVSPVPQPPQESASAAAPRPAATAAAAAGAASAGETRGTMEIAPSAAEAKRRSTPAVRVARLAPDGFLDAAPPPVTLDPIAIDSLTPSEFSLGSIGVEPLPAPTVIELPDLDPGSPDKQQIERF